MVNQERLSKIVGNNLFAWDSKLEIHVCFKRIVSSLKKEELFDIDFIKDIKGLCVGEHVENPIEKLIDFSRDDNIIDFFFKNSSVEYSPLDINSDVAEVELVVCIYYANRMGLKENFVDKIKSVKIKTPFGGFEV